MYSYITVKIYSVNIIENRCTFVENKNEFFFLLYPVYTTEKVCFSPHIYIRFFLLSRIYTYVFVPTTQIICTVHIIYTLHTTIFTSLYALIFCISIYSNRLVLILTNIPDLGHPHKSCLPQFC